MTTKQLLLILGLLAFLSCGEAQELPRGVPRTVWPDGRVTVDTMYTSKAYQRAALTLVLEEANRVAKELNLPERLPIGADDLKEAFICPFGYAYLNKVIGNVTSSRYWYSVGRADRFSDLAITPYDQTCMYLRDHSVIPVADIDTNAAYHLATQWLAAVGVDVRGLNRDCQVKARISEFWNGFRPGEKLRKSKCVPIYDVSWLSPTNRAQGFGNTAYVQLFAPTKMLLQLRISEPVYIRRKPLLITDLASLFPGNASIVTNRPVQIKVVAPPDPE